MQVSLSFEQKQEPSILLQSVLLPQLQGWSQIGPQYPKSHMHLYSLLQKPLIQGHGQSP